MPPRFIPSITITPLRRHCTNTSTLRIQLIACYLLRRHKSSMVARREIRRFAPLDPDLRNEHNAPAVQGIIFDVDGTLW
jgi:hypothetical protein